jgi:aryl-alcohol dehydrogenase-like predicted oxidoreductase
MEQLVRDGKVLYVGSSNFAGWDIATAQQLAGQRHFMGLVSEQSLYNLTARTVELEVIPALGHYGVGLFPWSPLGGGLLGGALKGATEGLRGSASLQQQSMTAGHSSRPTRGSATSSASSPPTWPSPGCYSSQR